MVTWPASLPQEPEVNGYNETPPELTQMTEPDEGPPIVRRFATAGPRLISMTMIMDKDQVETLETFMYTTLAGPVLPFDWVHPWKLTTQSFQFDGTPTIRALGGAQFIVSINLRQFP